MPVDGDNPPAPFARAGPRSGPVLFASSHSGRFYPPGMLRRARLAERDIRRSEDALVDLLLGGVAQAYPIITAAYGRAYLDLNRDPAELDPDMFTPALPAAAVKASERVAVGLGVVPRSVGPGRNIYARPLPAHEADRRIAEVHTPWHNAVARHLADAVGAHGHAVLIDCHSMPGAERREAANIVVGDLHGRSAAPALVALVADHLRLRGYRVARNQPYAGAYTLERHGRPEFGTHAIQIEIDRGLYMDEERLVPAAGFSKVADDLAGLADAIDAARPRLALGGNWPLAAE